MRIRRCIRWAWQGCFRLPGQGRHPGSGALVFFALYGALVGALVNWTGAVLGVVFMLLVYAPGYLWVSYDRARRHHRRHIRRP
jgi:Flp pilus assembly protein TadB